MRTTVNLILSALDHPHVEALDSDDGIEGDEPALYVHLDEDVTLIGPASEVRRWVEELSFKVAAS